MMLGLWGALYIPSCRNTVEGCANTHSHTHALRVKSHQCSHAAVQICLFCEIKLMCVGGACALCVYVLVCVFGSEFVVPYIPL